MRIPVRNGLPGSAINQSTGEPSLPPVDGSQTAADEPDQVEGQTHPADASVHGATARAGAESQPASGPTAGGPEHLAATGFPSQTEEAMGAQPSAQTESGFDSQAAGTQGRQPPAQAKAGFANQKAGAMGAQPSAQAETGFDSQAAGTQGRQPPAQTKSSPAGRPEGLRPSADQSAEPDWKERFIRISADFENYRKRVQRDEEAMRRREQARTLEAWLEVLDSTERALRSSQDRNSPWYQGFEAIYRQMLQVLEKQGITRMETDGQPFDPRLHEAIAAVSVPGHPKGTIVQTDRTGYRFADGELLRPARVVVAG
ncbi:MAG: nucleotide exchange factor GrpE [Bradymonadales bacterium]|nr:nucleotide exchange factor GrpE [Bradymonadales bacterium]